jgi:hypothetical protein
MRNVGPIRDGVSGYVCRSVVDMAKRVKTTHLEPRVVREYVEQNFSVERMAEQYAALYREILVPQRARTWDQDNPPQLRVEASSRKQSLV